MAKMGNDYGHNMVQRARKEQDKTARWIKARLNKEFAEDGEGFDRGEFEYVTFVFTRTGYMIEAEWKGGFSLDEKDVMKFLRGIGFPRLQTAEYEDGRGRYKVVYSFYGGSPGAVHFEDNL